MVTAGCSATRVRTIADISSQYGFRQASLVAAATAREPTMDVAALWRSLRTDPAKAASYNDNAMLRVNAVPPLGVWRPS